MELTEAQQSLKIAKTSLKQLEREVKAKPRHTLGIGQGNNGISFVGGYNTSDHVGLWLYADRQTKTAGIKFNF